MFLYRLVGAIGAAILFGASVASAAPPIDDYGKLPAIEFMTLSPSGDGLAYIGVDGNTRQLMVATKSYGTQAMATGGLTKVVGIRWASEDHLLIQASSTVEIGHDFTTAKAELSTILVLDLKTHKSFVIFQDRGDIAHVVDGLAGIAQLGDHWFGYFGGITYAAGAGDHHFDHGYPDLYRVDLDSGAVELVAHGNPLLHAWLVSSTGEVLARSLYSAETNHWQVLAGQDRQTVLAEGQSKFGGVELDHGRRADTVLIDRPTADGGRQLQELSLSGGAAVDIPDGDDVARTYFDPVSGLWIGYAKRADVPVPEMFPPGAAARVRGTTKAFPNQTVDLVSWSQDFDKIIVFTSGSGDSGAYWLVDIPTGDAKPLGYSYPSVQADDVGPIQMVDWKAADGLELHGVLSLPADRPAKALPLVVMPHGGPEARDYPIFDWWAQAFASRGYAVFQPNFRGSDGYGTAFRNAGFGQWGRKMQSDVSDGLAELARRGVVDPKRVCIVGGSYGGYASLAGVTVQNGLYRCAVSVAGVSDPAGLISESAFQRGDDNTAERYWKAFMGVNYRYAAEMDPFSPLKQAARADAPILLIHGANDTVVPVEQSRDMAKALRAAGKPVELLELPTADHWLLLEDTRRAMVTRSVAFVEKYNPPDPAPLQSARVSPSATQ